MSDLIQDTPNYYGVSQSLDALGNTPGSILVRGPGGWIALAPGPVGTVLTSQGPEALPIWA